jgi:phenylpropionate dioxygenase-like ring-hydroxylating dioxygenase large terminal subunit
MLNKQHYSSKASLDKDFEAIFSESWLYVGNKSELINKNDFLTVELCKKSIVVQNINGQIGAFQNICAHRFNRIQIEKKGNRPFYCQYHGWSYDKNGIPKVPQKNTFNKEELACKKLVKYQVDICGEFVFVNLNLQNEVSLKSYLGDIYSEIETLSKHIGVQISSDNLMHHANWKLLVENVLEGYHCPLVHRESLVKSGFCTKMATDIQFLGYHNKWHSHKVNNHFVNRKSAKLAFLDNRSYKHESFYHIFIYPSLVISSSEGLLFYVGNILPDSYNKTNLIIRFFAPILEGELAIKDKYLYEAFLTSAIESGKQVLLEDKPMVEGCQKGLEEDSIQTGILSEIEEVRIIHFHKSINIQYESHR